MSNSSVAPFVKWAGGKRQLIPQIRERMPEKYNDYYEIILYLMIRQKTYSHLRKKSIKQPTTGLRDFITRISSM